MPSKASAKTVDKALGPSWWLWLGEAKKVEADSSSSNVAQTRPGTKKAAVKKPDEDPSIESEAPEINDRFVGRVRFLEKVKDAETVRVVLIEEGMGNFGDGFYYTKEALESGVDVFEGKKFYCDHPSASEEEDRPERSVRDVAGHFEELECVESEDGPALLCANLKVVKGESCQYIRERIAHAIEYSKKYPDKAFIGLSINAAGNSSPVDLQEFMETAEIPASAIAKLEMAQEEGIDELRVVTEFLDATSCDLVTEAGAGGKILEFIEKEKSRMALKKKSKNAKESDKGREDGAHDNDGDDDDDDATADKHLKKEMGEADDDEMKHAKEAYEYFKKEGMKPAEAAKAAKGAVMCAKHMAAKKESENESESETETETENERESETEDDKGKKESARGGDRKLREDIISLKGQIAGLLKENAKGKRQKYLDKILEGSGLDALAKKTFRENAKGAASTEELDRMLKLFKEGYKGKTKRDEEEEEENDRRHFGGGTRVKESASDSESEEEEEEEEENDRPSKAPFSKCFRSERD